MMPTKPDSAAQAAGAQHVFLGDSAPLLRVRREIASFAGSSAPVLITGETGTGKELVARKLHEQSPRAKGPFAAVNCGGMPSTLIASELFGYEKGAFTGATQSKIGRLEATSGGTLFLDEIGDLDMELQPFFLRFLQESMVDRLGARQPVKVDLRIVAATNKCVEELIAAGKFREDLYFRLKMLSIHLPPLRECPSDILPIVHHYIESFATSEGRPAPTLSPQAEAALLEHDWPGNVRELIGRVHRALATAANDALTDEDFGFRTRDRRRSSRPGRSSPQPRAAPAAAPDSHDAQAGVAGAAPEPPPHADLGEARTLAEIKDRAEAAAIRNALHNKRHRLNDAANALNVSRVTLYRLMKKHNISASAVPD